MALWQLARVSIVNTEVAVLTDRGIFGSVGPLHSSASPYHTLSKTPQQTRLVISQRKNTCTAHNAALKRCDDLGGRAAGRYLRM